MTDWYYNDAQQQQHGPISAGELTALHNKGLLTGDTLVWRDGLSAWKPWREMIHEVIVGGVAGDAQAEAAAKAAALAALDDGAYRPYATIAPSPYTPPQARVAQAPLRSTGSGYVVYAGFWKRFAAAVIDNFALGIIGVLMGLGRSSGRPGVDDVIIQVVTMLVGATYFGFMHASKNQASLGKMAVGIKIVRSDGESISFLRGFARYFAMIPSALILMIGYIMAGFTERKQALHDMMCDTIVVDKYAFTDQEDQQDESLGVVTIIIMCLGILGILALLVGVLILGAALAGMAR